MKKVINRLMKVGAICLTAVILMTQFSAIASAAPTSDTENSEISEHKSISESNEEHSDSEDSQEKERQLERASSEKPDSSSEKKDQSNIGTNSNPGTGTDEANAEATNTGKDGTGASGTSSDTSTIAASDAASTETSIDGNVENLGEIKDDKKYESEDQDAPSFDEHVSISGVKINVAAEEGVFPEGATLSVNKVSSAQENLAEQAVDEERPKQQNVAVSYTWDIKVLDEDGNEIQPADDSKVKVSFTLEEVADKNLETNVYHITDDDNAEKLEVETDGRTATTETEGFSLYTVEFTYNDLQYVMPGDSEIKLAEILDFVGLQGEVSAVTVSDESLFSASRSGENGNGEWYIIAHRAFSSDEWMKVIINDVTYEIYVTDSGYPLDGSGTAQDPYRIYDTSDWMTFSELLRNEADKYLDTHFKLMQDITVEGMYNPYTPRNYVISFFEGTFDGNGKTLTFKYTNGAINCCAPFAYLFNASIKNLKVDGYVSTSNGHNHTAGIAGNVAGNCTIENCNVSATIRSSGTGDGQNGGLVGSVSTDASLTVKNCVFCGSITSSNASGFKSGGFVGYNEGTVTVINSLFNPTNINVRLCSFSNDKDGCTSSYTYAYRTNDSGTCQGVRVYDSKPSDITTKQVTCADGVMRWAQAGEISFNANGHGIAPSTQTILYGECATQPTAPTTADKYVFKGWYQDENCYQPFLFSTKIYQDYCLYAKWNKLAEISFDPNGGTGTMPTQTIEVTGSSSYQLPECTFSAPSGKGFKNWSVNGTSHNPVYWLPVRDDIVVKAEWDDLITVSFDPNGGTGTMNPVSVVKGTQYTLPACGYSGTDNKVFTGWTVGSTDYAPGQKITINAPTIIKANWTNLLTIDNEETIVASSITLDIGRIEVSGNSTLILNEGVTLTAPKGIHVPSGSTLTIKGKGNLVICPGYDDGNNACIGGDENGDFGTIIIDGGNLSLNSKNTYSACIGKAYNGGSGGEVIINGGTIDASSGFWGCGIGGDGVSVTINGGRITAPVIGNYPDRMAGIKGSTILLGWTNTTDFITSDSYRGTVTFASGDKFVLDNTNTEATSTNIAGNKIVPARTVTVGPITNGTVTLGDNIASGSPFAIGSTVNLRVQSASGYRIGSVKYGATEIDPTAGVYSFTMPNEDVTVTAEFEPIPATAPRIKSHPGNLVLVTGFTSGNVLSVSATASTGHTLSYQWYYNTSATNTGGTMINGATAASYTIPTNTVARTHYYYCVVTATNNSNGTTATATSIVSTVLITDKIPQTLTFASTSVEKNCGDRPFTLTPTGANTAVTYESGNPEVATVNETTGEVTILAEGTAVITATAEGTSIYLSASASYTITVHPRPAVTPGPSSDKDDDHESGNSEGSGNSGGSGASGNSSVQTNAGSTQKGSAAGTTTSVATTPGAEQASTQVTPVKEKAKSSNSQGSANGTPAPADSNAPASGDQAASAPSAANPAKATAPAASDDTPETGEGNDGLANVKGAWNPLRAILPAVTVTIAGAGFGAHHLVRKRRVKK